ncbi:hypothetical protein BDY24DRAFT_439722 [Mrakia frigida]|uniref:uncharacterized protein n=1 Tax=Mrakia frigida TaxID=29902 RepID=UPI003FCC137E
MSLISRVILVGFVLTLIATTLSSWILTSINIEHTRSFSGTHSRIDAGFLVSTVLGWLWFCVILITPAVVAVGITIFFTCWWLAQAVAYTVRRWDFPTRCPPNVPVPTGCRALYRALWAFAWIDFILALFLICFLVWLIDRHFKKHPGESSASTMTWDLPKGRGHRENEQFNINEKQVPPPGTSEAAHHPGTNVVEPAQY